MVQVSLILHSRWHDDSLYAEERDLPTDDIIMLRIARNKHDNKKSNPAVISIYAWYMILQIYQYTLLQNNS